ncbi:hypothetical protein A4X09_0g1387 [Tilletia walkeri]|uniref:BSD domain-containing protein n=1 Tax=Tilletia walkeri TaxID=117179 RepID=A0A8X7NFC9_9BASI|nr:hypothetical protein A4X09_0g1387 [Tilletia walkeri]
MDGEAHEQLRLASTEESAPLHHRHNNDDDDLPIQRHPTPAFEAEISQLTSSLTSWWGSVTKQSQATLDQARTHIQKQGGILNAAKSEWSKLEDHLNDASQRAKEAAFAPADDGEDAGMVPAPTDDDLLQASERPVRMSSATTASLDKGKGRAPPSPVEDPNQATRSEQVEEDTPQMISADGSLFDTGSTTTRGSHTRGSASIDLNAVAKEAQVQATQLANNATSFFSRIGSQLASDPRVANLQKSLATSLSSGPASREAGVEGTGLHDSEKSEGHTDVSTTSASGTQNALPTWSATQALARKYWAEAEAVARDVGKDVRDLVNEVVQVVPPSEASGSGNASGITREDLQGEVDKLAREKEGEGVYRPVSQQQPRQKKQASTGEELGQEEDEDFDWDDGEDHSKSRVQEKAPESEVSPSPAVPASSSTASVPPAATAKSVPATPSSTGSRDTGLQTTTGPQTDRFEVSPSSAGADDEGDSDWE